MKLLNLILSFFGYKAVVFSTKSLEHIREDKHAQLARELGRPWGAR